MPLSLLSGTAVGMLASLPLHFGVGLGAVPSSLLLCYGLFYDAPAPVSE